MKNIPKNIIPGVGLGELKLGISMGKAKQILGEPESKEKYSYTDSDKDLTETWYYRDLGINIGFDQEDNWRMTLITIESENYKFGNNIFIGQEKSKILLELKGLKINDLKYEDISTIENPTHELVSSYALGINFWFDYEKLTEIQIGPVFIDNETIKWPE